MRIIHCLRAPVGGLFRHVLDLAGEQARRGHDVGIIADSTTSNALTDEKFAAIEPAMRLGVMRIAISRSPGISDLSAARAVAAIVRRIGPDVLHGHGAKGGAYARLAGAMLSLRASRPRVYYTPHGGTLNLPASAAGSAALLAVERQLERFSDGLIFESAFAADAYAARVGQPRAPVRVIHNGLMPADFSPVAASRNATDLLFIGELRDLKGVDVLLDAIADLNRQRPVTATIVGAGRDEATLKEQAARLGLMSSVRFTGALAAREALPLGRAMVVPSLKESFPYVVLEAAAAGLPVIATSVGGIPEIVAGTDTVLVEPGSSQALAAGIREMLSDPAAAAARTGRLRDKVAQKFTVAAMTSAVLDFYSARPG